MHSHKKPIPNFTQPVSDWTVPFNVHNSAKQQYFAYFKFTLNGARVPAALENLSKNEWSPR